jgi:hypothetical protein
MRLKDLNPYDNSKNVLHAMRNMKQLNGERQHLITFAAAVVFTAWE